MRLDITPLEKAVAALEKSLRFLRSEMSSDPDLREQFRAATVQGFETVYEMAYKMIRRQLEQIVPAPGALREITFQELMRTAAEAGLVRDPRAWWNYRDLRNRTPHTYDEAEAEAIVSEVEGFFQDVRFTLAELERRNHGAD